MNEADLSEEPFFWLACDTAGHVAAFLGWGAVPHAAVKGAEATAVLQALKEVPRAGSGGYRVRDQSDGPLYDFKSRMHPKASLRGMVRRMPGTHARPKGPPCVLFLGPSAEPPADARPLRAREGRAFLIPFLPRVASKLWASPDCLGCYPLEDPAFYEDLAGLGVFLYQTTHSRHEAQEGEDHAGIQGRVFTPSHPLRASELPAELREKIAAVRFAALFSEAEYIQPCDACPCGLQEEGFGEFEYWSVEQDAFLVHEDAVEKRRQARESRTGTIIAVCLIVVAVLSGAVWLVLSR